MTVGAGLAQLYQAVEWFFIGYIGTLNIIYLVLTVLGFFVLRNMPPRSDLELEASLLRSSLVPKISIIAPAYNEAVSIHQSVLGMLGLEYPNLEVIVVNDGSSDDTLAILVERFRLYKSNRVLSGDLATGRVRGV